MAMTKMDSFSVSFYIRKSRNRRKDYYIYCCIKVNNTSPRELRIPGTVQRDEWDLRKARPKQNTDLLIKLSLYLDTVKWKLYNIYLDVKLKEGNLTSENIKNTYLGKGSLDYSILQLIDKAIVKYDKELSRGSIKNYAATRYYVKAFCKTKYMSEDLPLKSLTCAFIDELKTYILTNSLKPNRPCTNNGCMKHMERIKKIIAWAYDMRFIDRNIFTSFKIKKNRYESKRLNWSQLKTLENRTLKLPMISLVRDLFVFCCYTGMAPIDMQHLLPY